MGDRSVGCSASYLDPNITSNGIDCSLYQNAFQTLGAHVVPLGIRFYDGDMFPAEFTNAIFIAQRGSGDSDSYGYRIAVVKLTGNGATDVQNHEIFATGFYNYETEEIYGRPVDIEILNDGSLVISDDHANQIYRVTYDGADDDTIFSTDTVDEECDYDYVDFPLLVPFDIDLVNDDFSIEYYTYPETSIIKQPRAIRTAYYDGATIVYVGSKQFSMDQAYVMIDYESDGINDAEFVIFESTSVDSSYSPASLALSYDGNNDLYISLTDALIKCDGNVHEQVLAFTSSTDRLSNCNKIMDIPLTPEDTDKPWNLRRYIGFSKTSNELCMSNGMTCDDCAHESVDISFPHGTITCFNDHSSAAMLATNMSDANDPNIILKADGVRNSVGFDWHPDDDGFYFTDNGRDEVHETYPDDELNFVGNNGHFGFPECHSLGSGSLDIRDINCEESFIDPNISDPSTVNCSIYQNAFQSLGAHVVPLGMRFYDGDMFPNVYTNAIFIAQRGSGDSDSFGYRIAVVKLSDDMSRVVSHSVFASGFYDYGTDTIYGRPVDIEILNDGSLLIADDNGNGAIYRVTFNGNRNDEVLTYNASSPNPICDFSYASSI